MSASWFFYFSQNKTFVALSETRTWSGAYFSTSAVEKLIADSHPLHRHLQLSKTI
jgi:hypothetical protein